MTMTKAKTPKQINKSCVNKAKKCRTSGKMFAILGYLLDEKFTNPHFTDMVITSDGHALGQLAGDVGLNEFIGAEADVRRNVEGFADAALFNAAEKAHILAKLDACRR